MTIRKPFHQCKKCGIPYQKTIFCRKCRKPCCKNCIIKDGICIDCYVEKNTEKEHNLYSDEKNKNEQATT